jgi:hypothetical protein
MLDALAVMLELPYSATMFGGLGLAVLDPGRVIPNTDLPRDHRDESQAVLTLQLGYVTTATAPDGVDDGIDIIEHVEVGASPCSRRPLSFHRNHAADPVGGTHERRYRSHRNAGRHRDAAVSQQGFGTPLIAAAHNFWPETVRTFGALAELVTPPLNVPVTHPIYLAAKALKAQQPSPAQFKVGKRTSLATQVFKLTPTVAPAGSTYTFAIDGRALTASVPAAGTVAQACTAIAAAITALTPPLGVTAVGRQPLSP